MTAKDVITMCMDLAEMVTRDYLKDFSDADLLVRTTPNANHAAWQLGHVISGERYFMTSLGHPMPDLPAGFDEAHSKEGASSDDPKRFLTRDGYLELKQKVRAVTRAALKSTPDADLDKPGPESMRSYAPTIGAVFHLVGSHEIMHNSQFTPIRRKLNKPVLF